MKLYSNRNTSLIILMAGLMLLSCNPQKISFEKLQKEMLSRMIGTWQVEGEQLFEEWSHSPDSGYFATSYAVENEAKVIIEMIRLIREKDGICYEATVLDQNDGKPVRFKLVGLTDNKMIYFNPEHDFPKKIEYEFLDDNHLLATVGDGKGDLGKTFIIKFKRVLKDQQ